MNNPPSSEPNSQEWRKVSPSESIPISVYLRANTEDTFSPVMDRELAFSMRALGVAGSIAVGATAAQEAFIDTEETLQQMLDAVPPAPANETITITDAPYGDITGTPGAVTSELEERIFLSDFAASSIALVKYLGVAVCGISAAYNIHLISKAVGGWRAMGKTALSLGRSIIPFSPKR